MFRWSVSSDIFQATALNGQGEEPCQELTAESEEGPLGQHDKYIHFPALFAEDLNHDVPARKITTELLEAISPTLHNAPSMHRPFPAERREEHLLPTLHSRHRPACSPSSNPRYRLILHLARPPRFHPAPRFPKMWNCSESGMPVSSVEGPRLLQPA